MHLFRHRAAMAALAVTLLFTPSTAQGFVPPDPADYTGSNYMPCSTLAISNSLSLLSPNGMSLEGTFSELQVKAEIEEFAKANINVIRMFGSFYGWLTNPSDYMANLAVLARACANHNIAITYVMWSSTSNSFFPLYTSVDPNAAGYDGSLHRTLQRIAAGYTIASPISYQTVLSMQEPWLFVLHDEPGNSLFMPPFNGVMSSWPNNLGQKVEAYIDAIGGFFATHPDGSRVFASYDLFNESDCCNLNLPNEAELYRATYNGLAGQHDADGAPIPKFTAGFADYTRTRQHHDQLVAMGVKQTYLSFHCYESRPLFSSIAANNAAVGQQLGMTVVCSEFYDRNRPGHLGNLNGFLSDLRGNGIAGQVWGLLSINLLIAGPGGGFLHFDGMRIPQAAPFAWQSSPQSFRSATGSSPDMNALINW